MEAIRLQKFLAEAGLASRRQAEIWIADGDVRVNGKVASLGDRVDPDQDQISVRRRLVNRRQPKITLAMHKPRGVVCTRADRYAGTTIFDLLPPLWRKMRLFCAGRLDKDSEGLVVLTTDGDLAHRLTHPSSGVVKRYHVTLAEPFPKTRVSRLIRGVTVDGEHFQVERAFPIRPDPAGRSTSLEVHLHHGKKREIRRLFAALGYDVRRLKRFQIGGLLLKGIPLRGVKQLSKKELVLLFQTINPA